MDPVTAILRCDFEAAEYLRGSLSDQQVSEITSLYNSLAKWSQKDIAIHLLQDCESSAIQSVMKDAIKSPTVESRAAAICCLENDFGMFETFLRGGFVDASLVDAAIQTYLSQHQK